jgi:hypothetical protein
VYPKTDLRVQRFTHSKSERASSSFVDEGIPQATNVAVALRADVVQSPKTLCSCCGALASTQHTTDVRSAGAIPVGSGERGGSGTGPSGGGSGSPLEECMEALLL